ncbi:ABC transporter ATP-binding protein [Candidatus Epulonipiscium viviparus]|uniref:ABC transporter ATP-binding protein n=1 Tax=Candidatus Epulonipiscium viviparus TaxID=420336 RepID=UPI00049770A8|nr:ABC transporter ATP-binding protein [Candidatus Epulopiscium viviparus]
MEPILEITNLCIDFKTPSGLLRACDGVTINIYKGDIVGIIGESGSGKSTMAAGILQTIKPPGKIADGKILYHAPDGEVVDLLQLGAKGYQKFRWSKIATVFQAAQNVLNPSLLVREHFLETAWAHNPKIEEREIVAKAKTILAQVRLEERVLDSYPHQLSGGMKQRTIIALSLLLEPDIIILDEPTTALDVITQWYIIDILKKIHHEREITMIFLTHDVSIIGSIVDRIAVMYAGQLVEYGKVEDVFKVPKHPYTYGLMHAIPSLKDDISKRRAIPGYPPNMLKLPNICRFAPRCPVYLEDGCGGNKELTDFMYETPTGQISRCYKWEEVNTLCH